MSANSARLPRPIDRFGCWLMLQRPALTMAPRTRASQPTIRLFVSDFDFFQKINSYFFKPHCAIYRHCTANRAGPRRLIFWKRRQRAQEVTGRRRRKVWWFFTRIKTENSSLFSLFYKDEPRPVTNARAVPLKDQSDEAQSSFAKMSKRFSRSLKNLMQMDGKCHTFVI